MTAQRVADTTIEGIKVLISQIVDERLQQARSLERPVKKRSFQEIVDSNEICGQHHQDRHRR